jgi:hypothetical protein
MIVATYTTEETTGKSKTQIITNSTLFISLNSSRLDPKLQKFVSKI